MTAKKSTEPVEAVSTPEVTQPASAQQPAYDPNMYYRKPASKAKWLTFEYVVAMASTVLVAGLLVHIITALFGLWSLIPYAFYLLMVYILATKMSMWWCLGIATLCWIVAAAFLIYGWQMFQY